MMHELIDKSLDFDKYEKADDKIAVNKLYKKAIRFFDDLELEVDHILSHNIYGTDFITIGTVYIPIQSRTPNGNKQMQFVFTRVGISITVSYGDSVYKDFVTQLQGRSKVKLREKIMEFIFLSL